MRKLLLTATILIIAISTTLSAETTHKKIKDAVGEWIVSNDITVAEAENKALFEAKKEAIRLAGVSEKVLSLYSYIAKGNNNSVSEYTSQWSNFAVEGSVRILSKKTDTRWNEATKQQIKRVTIDAEVTPPAPEDPSFVVKCKGLQQMYRSGETMSLNVGAYGSDYSVYIFQVDGKNSSVIYPNTWEPMALFENGIAYDFPIVKNIQYTLGNDNADGSPQNLLLMVVATSEEMPFTEESPTFETISLWYHSISSKKSLFIAPFTVL